MGGEEDRSCRRQGYRTPEKDIKIEEISIEELKQDWDQWQQIKKKRRDIKFVSTVESSGIQLRIVGAEDRKSKKKEESTRGTSCQKRIKISKLLAALL